MTGPVTVAFQAVELPSGAKIEKFVDAGHNPPDGVIVHYWLKDKPEALTLSIVDGDGTQVRSFSSKRDTDTAPSPDSAGQSAPEAAGEGSSQGDVLQAGAEEEAAEEAELDGGPVWAPDEVGMNRFVWDYRYERPLKLSKLSRSAREEALEGQSGPRAMPGTYEVRLTIGDRTLSEAFELLADPRLAVSNADLRAQFELKLAIRDRISETHTTINQIRHIREQIEEWEKRAVGKPEVVSAAKSLKDQLTAIEGDLINLDFEKPRPGPNRIKEKWDALSSMIDESDDAPTAGAREVYEMLRSQLEAQRAALQRLLDGPLAEFIALLQSQGVPAIIP
jgi:hypothetical protein